MTFGGGGPFAAVGAVDLDGARRHIDLCLDAGVNLIDTADVYSSGLSEELVGQALVGRRDRALLATKARMPMGEGPNDAGLSRHHLIEGCEASLRRLRTDHIDLYQLHTPDPVTPIAETLAALHELVLAGKVRYIGHSNFSSWQLAEAAHLADELGLTPFVSAQNHWSLLDREIERELVPAAEHYGVGVIPFFPLAQGLLTGKVRSRDAIAAGTRLASRSHLVTDERLDRVEALSVLAEKLGRTLLDLAIGGLAARPVTGSVICGATRPEQVTANVAAGSWTPTPDQLAAIDEVVPPPRT
jgi:aryl-alcohol dehydrogenase-like predicted oxidoreductase